MISVTHFSLAQNPLAKQWDYRFGGTDWDYFNCLLQTVDGGYILGGYSNSAINGDKTQITAGNGDYWIVKTDALGIKQWDKDFGGSNYEVLNSVQQTTDGGYILGGFSYSGISGDKTQASHGGPDYWIVKTDSLGNKEWDKDFGGLGQDILNCVRQTTDGGYILGGYTSTLVNGDKTQANWGLWDYWIVKTDSLGNKLWDKDFGGTNEDYLFALQQTTDGGYILGGESLSGISGNKTQPSWGLEDYWIVKTDSLGNMQWDKDLGGTSSDHFSCMQQTADGGYILGGNSSSGISGDKTQSTWGYDDYWIVKTDSLGTIQWDKDFGGTSDEDADGNISQTADKGYLMAGASYSGISGDKTENNLGTKQTWIVKTDSLGIKQWDKTLRTNTPIEDEVGVALQTKDGCYAIANYTDAGIGGDKTQAGWGDHDYWFIKFCDTTGSYLIVPPVSFLNSSTSTLCENSCISFTDQSLHNPTSWQWIFNGASTSTSSLQNPVNICYNTAGIFDVTLITGNPYGGDTLTIPGYITVYANPVPVIIQSNDTLTSSAAYSYQWFMNGSVIPGATNQQLIILQSGDYIVTVTDSPGCFASDTIVAVLMLPQSAFNSNAVSGCPESCFDFTNASLNATSYQWFFTGGNPATSSQQNPNICYTNPGVYSVMLVASGNFASDTLVQAGYITIFTTPAVSISQNANLLTCNPAASSYQWLLNGNQIPGAASQTLFITQTGIYAVDVTDSNGCPAADTLIVNSIPSPNFSVTDAALCEKFCTSFSDQSSNNPTFWQWEFPGGNPSSSTDQNPSSICYTTPGTYDVTLVTTNANGNDTLTLHNYITVYATPPFPTITQSGNLLTSSPASYYQWQFNTVDIPGATNQSFTIWQSGYYTVIVADSNSCKNSFTEYVLISGIGDATSDPGIFTYPNPSSGNFMVELTNACPAFCGGLMVGEVSIDIMNTLGQIVFSAHEKISSSPFKKEIGLGDVARGVYFIRIKTANELVSKKILIAE